MAPPKPKEPDRILIPGRPDLDRCDNKVVSARYTAWTFVPVATMEQFRRFANMYFLVVGIIMAVGYYTNAFESAISPWTTLGPLAVVIAISLLVEGSSDYKRHKNDEETNNAPCVILRRAEEIDADEEATRDENIIGGKNVIVDINKAYYSETTREKSSANVDGAVNVKVGFQKVRRMDIRQGHFVLVKNREMVPADMLLLASSNDGGGAYIETSSIDGETNLKLRTSPNLPKHVLRQLRDGKNMQSIQESNDEEDGPEDDLHSFETIQQATKRLTRFSCLGRPAGECVLFHPNYAGTEETDAPQQQERRQSRLSALKDRVKSGVGAVSQAFSDQPSSAMGMEVQHDDRYVAALLTEPPNSSVHTFKGKLTLPPFQKDGACHDIPLGPENVLLRGAVIRNTEWAIGVAFFTGKDTKLIQNSFDTPSKFSQLDILMNYTVLAILCIMVLCITYLATMAVDTTQSDFDDLWYAGFNKNSSEPWPYLRDFDYEPPAWTTSSQNWMQYFCLYITLLSNFVPLSMYVSIEFITYCMLWFIYVDIDMYDATTNTRAAARSTIVTDLGRIQYIFSDKTGTLTQNVMRFKRCSVDGMVFGAPIQKARPDAQDEPQTSFHPLRNLSVGRFKRQSRVGLEGMGQTSSADDLQPDKKLTFNAEMFLRVMSLCHTVVVEKDIDKKTEIDESMSVASQSSKTSLFGSVTMSLFRRKRASTGESISVASPLSVVSEHSAFTDTQHSGARGRTSTIASLPPNDPSAKGVDGAPYGFAYQAESPDEGALVAAASQTYGFQVVGRDSNGMRLKTNVPSHLQDEHVTEGLKSKSITLKRLAAESANELVDADGTFPADSNHSSVAEQDASSQGEEREETWAILAINKFDSDRKRMSILLRSPPELGSLPILFCKGADSAMLDPAVCSSNQLLQSKDEGQEMEQDYTPSRPQSIHERDRDVSALTTVEENDDVDEEGWEMAQMLGIQAHLGDFASEGLRTLVLGMRVLSEDECSRWLDMYREAATSMKGRSELLTEAALNIERGLHIVGATAIEDKLQVGVPKTIATLEKAGIKLWVLTGDKRETAIEIGYSTHVLSPKMHLTEVPDEGKQHVRTQMAMEFMHLVKMGKLVEYQKASLESKRNRRLREHLVDIAFTIGKIYRKFMSSMNQCWIFILKFLGLKKRAEWKTQEAKEIAAAEDCILKDRERRAKTRARAEKVIRGWLKSEEGRAESRRRKSKSLKTPSKSDGDDGEDELSLVSEETPQVFNRSSSAKRLLQDIRMSGRMSHTELRQLSLAHHTAKQADDFEPLVDEDTLSLESFFPGDANDKMRTFDKKKRTLLERIFAIDRQVRKGQLKKHLSKTKLASLAEEGPHMSLQSVGSGVASREGPRALVIEGAALKHLLGDAELEEILFAVASNCDAVIACRVSPKQKAELVRLVRRNVKPTPITLAIGDGANDVGMIQEAHVGVGISGKEGKQAVNASDFAIAQFRFLEDLLLIHGRWNFFRLSTVILFSFYKNAVMAGCLVVFTSRTVYSGTPLFDEWLIAMLNFVAGIPIIMLGLFDRCLSKDYIRRNPQVYKATRENELMTPRILFRWIVLVFIHIGTIFYFTVPQQSFGGGVTSAWSGLMRNEPNDAPGNGEGGDLKSVGTVSFTCLILLLAYKVLYESRSLIHGRWPAFTCRKGVGEGALSRMAYTWIGVTYGSIGFYLAAISIYSAIGRFVTNDLSPYVDTAFHVLGTRSLSWLLIAFVPIFGIVFDVCGKVFSNMFYPTQTQIHVEMQAKERMNARKERVTRTRSRMREQRENSANAVVDEV